VYNYVNPTLIADRHRAFHRGHQTEGEATTADLGVAIVAASVARSTSIAVSSSAGA
jgi:hypothetical protein